MDNINIEELGKLARKAAVEAGKAIMEVYESGDFEEDTKSDQSPLTLADRRSHEIIENQLKETGLPILSEEGKQMEYATRKNWKYYWLVDPLDGTKEFIKRNGEFTVNIALMEGQYPVSGVIYVPVKKELYYGSNEEGASLKIGDGQEQRIGAATFNKADSQLFIVASRSHMDDSTKAYMEKFDNPTIKSMGSSLKFMLIAKGEAHLYPRLAPTMEWDTAAAQAIVEAAGGMVKRFDTNKRMFYNKEDLLNPHFVCHGNMTGE